ncbi:NUCLEOLAR RNA-ASSOCIATED PROTEIN, putative [Babesia bigemina]|uniref:NUCLEOLAR RNA-ASSOCIATED PROTEIN, putative n=1 Tax=Babesia bigemina TaxID=5866 RepID=A0A061D1G2_BABBI|nr:NUCLEOLAR RNA-ASSOCIATED PROTEIN, putative [Babesia bigemina]CDR94478.1 NUCLEOLAR RNA-ASSOCIATED PROTEIN, putative [Babesia bigemina]|eukprot:XP_012766664.1 NUCLEOLAR RNA-ASSOCIATED PROTEIN, putative [Babesia bigemina]
MPEKKRPRKRKASGGHRNPLIGDRHLPLEQALDSGVIYGTSLPISRLNRLINRECVDFDADGSSVGQSPLATLLRNFRSFVTTVPTVLLTREFIDKPAYGRCFRTEFNACWSNFEYGVPESVDVVGRGALGFLNRRNPTLDVSIMLPQAIFNPKDYINYRYLNKRNAWLCRLYEDVHVALEAGESSPLLEGLENCHLVAELHFRRPKVYIDFLLAVANATYCLRVSAHVDEATFKHAPMAPTRNNVRSTTTLLKPSGVPGTPAESDMRPTPTYNAAILEDLLKNRVNAKLRAAFDSHAKMRGALTLLTVWTHTQGLTATNLGCTSDRLHIVASMWCSKGLEAAEKRRVRRKVKDESDDAASVDDSENVEVSHDPTSSSPISGGSTDATETHGLGDEADKSSIQSGLPFDNGLTGCVFALILCHVVSANRFPTEIEAFPLFLAALKFLASMDFKQKYYIIGRDKAFNSHAADDDDSTTAVSTSDDASNEDGAKLLEAQQKVINAISIPELYLDDSVSFNVLHKVVVTFDEVVARAKATLTVARDLSSPFLYCQLFDISHDTRCYSDVRLIMNTCPLLSGFDIWELGESEYMAARIRSILEYGLKDRLAHLYFRMSESNALMVMIGFDESVQRSTDVGPLTNSPESVYFRHFWKRLTETRSFADGSICECILWNQILPDIDVDPCASSSLERLAGRNLNVQILSTILQLHLDQFKPVILDCDTSFAFDKPNTKDGDRRHLMYVELPIVVSDNRLATEHRTKLMNAYNELNGLLRSLENVPLKVSNVFVCSPEFGYADVGPSKLRHRLLVELETSTKWPKDPAAILSVKIALGIAMLKELFKNHDIKSRMSENGDMELQFQGIRFCIKILCQRETQPLIESIRNFNPDENKLPTDSSLEMVREYFRSIQIERCKVGALKSPSFSASVRLSKAFTASCIVPNGEFLCETLNWFIFCSQDFLLSPPLSGYTGFMRFLYMVAHYDWEHRPLVIYNEEPRYEMLDSKKPSWAPYFWLCTPEDPYCLVPNMPSTMLSKRFVGQCQRFIAKLDEHFMKPINLAAYFAAERRAYNMTLELENVYRKLKYSAGGESFKLSQEEAHFLLDTFVTSLKKSFSGILELAYNHLELQGTHTPAGNIMIYVKINPMACIPTGSPKGSWPHHMIICDGRTIFVPNMPAIWTHIHAMGDGLLREIRFT